VSFEIGPVSAPEVRAVRLVVKGWGHAVPMRTERWSELSAEREVRYTGNERVLVITMSKTSGVAEGLYRLVAGESGPKFRQEFSSA